MPSVSSLDRLPIGSRGRLPLPNAGKSTATSILGSLWRGFVILIEAIIPSSISSIFSCASVKEDVRPVTERKTSTISGRKYFLDPESIREAMDYKDQINTVVRILENDEGEAKLREAIKELPKSIQVKFCALGVRAKNNKESPFNKTEQLKFFKELQEKVWVVSTSRRLNIDPVLLEAARTCQPELQMIVKILREDQFRRSLSSLYLGERNKLPKIIRDKLAEKQAKNTTKSGVKFKLTPSQLLRFFEPFLLDK